MTKVLRVENKIRVLRAIHHMSQTELAKLLGVSRQHMSVLENNHSEGLFYEQIAKLMEVFNLDSFDDLFKLIEVEEDKEPGQVEPTGEVAY